MAANLQTTFKPAFLYENCYIFSQILLKFVPNGNLHYAELVFIWTNAGQVVWYMRHSALLND